MNGDNKPGTPNQEIVGNRREIIIWNCAMRPFIKRLKKYQTMRMLFDIYKCLIGRASVTTVVPIYFDGWKLATGTRTPWTDGGTNVLSKNFTETDCQIKKLVADKKIILTQFNQEHVSAELEGLTWRHYLVFWSVTYAIQNSNSTSKNLAEFGVCDGLTALYAISAARKLQVPYVSYLYDAWEGMKEELLLVSEKLSAGSYSYLNLENTKNNLKSFGAEKQVFNKGFIPEVFDGARNPDQLVWIHIDLNSAMPTLHTLEKFWDLLVVGGLVLLDDFAWPGYEDTQLEVEKWSRDKKCNILHLPTGQAIIFKQ